LGENFVFVLHLSGNVGGGLLLQLEQSLLLGVPSGGANLSLSLQLFNNVAVLPANFGAEILESGELATRGESDDAESIRDNHTLNLVKRRRAAVQNLQSVQGELTANGLVGQHSANGSPKEHGRSSEVNRTPLRVGVHALLEEVHEFVLVADD
jgi:hypothetical protein